MKSDSARPKTPAKEKADERLTSRGLFARAKVDVDPMAFCIRDSVFRGYYVFSHGNYYMTKDGEWTHGCTAPDDGNWWNTRSEAQEALEKFRLANVPTLPPA